MNTCNRYNNLMWLSYARGALDSVAVAELESHCASCSDCHKQLDFFRKIADIIDLNRTVPPESWTSEAAAKFGSTDDSGRSRIFGDLIFDSHLHTAEAVRSSVAERRHLIFDLFEYEVDLALEYSGRQLKLMMGQLLPKTADSSGVLPDCNLELRVAARTYSTKPNQFGEFSFTVDSQDTGGSLELRCIFEEGSCAAVLIPC
jgi:hypothetical protein